MPASMDRDAVDDVRAKEPMSILFAFTPRRVISESRDHFDIVTFRAQEFAQRDIVGRDAG